MAAGSALPVPQSINEVAEALTGQPADASAFAAAVEAGTAGYKWSGKEGQSDEFAAHLSKVIIQDALEAALENAKGAA